MALTGTAIGNFAIPPINQLLLSEFNFTFALLMIGAIQLNLCVAATLYRPIEDNYKQNQGIRLLTVSSIGHANMFRWDETWRLSPDEMWLPRKTRSISQNAVSRRNILHNCNMVFGEDPPWTNIG